MISQPIMVIARMARSHRGGGLEGKQGIHDGNGCLSRKKDLRSDASYGIVLAFDKGIKVINGPLSNVWLSGDIRDIKLINFNSGIKRILVSRNNDRAGAYAVVRGKGNLLARSH